jgi:hypothetical protein
VKGDQIWVILSRRWVRIRVLVTLVLLVMDDNVRLFLTNKATAKLIGYIWCLVERFGSELRVTCGELLFICSASVVPFCGMHSRLAQRLGA